MPSRVAFASTTSQTWSDSQSSDTSLVVYSMRQGVICRDHACRSSTDARARQIYQTLSLVHQFFAEEFDHDGFDGFGSIAPIELEWDQVNASWSCTSYVGGRSCSLKFHNKYVTDIKVVAHEYTHAIVDTLAPLNYQRQSGALSEGLADVFAIAFFHWLKGQMSDWKIVDRDLEAHPEPFILLLETPNLDNDFGYVHKNSTVVSHAFCEAVKMSKQKTWQAVAHVWFEAMQQMQPNETLAGFAAKTRNVASDYFLDREANRHLVGIIAASWKHVGIAA